MFKVELIINGTTLNTTPEANIAKRMRGDFSGKTTLVNWEDITISKKRSEFGFVDNIITNSFQFSGEAAEMIRNEYYSKGLALASGQVAISRLIDKHPDKRKLLTFEEIERLELDYSTYEDDTNIVTIGSQNNSLAAIIKAKKSQVYDIEVDGIKSALPLDYDRIEIMFSEKWFMGVELPETTGVYEFRLYSTLGSFAYFPLIKEDNPPKTGTITPGNNKSDENLITINQDCSLHFNFEFTIEILYSWVALGANISIVRERAGESPFEIYTQPITVLSFPDWGVEPITTFKCDKTADFKAGDTISMRVSLSGITTDMMYIDAKVYDVESLSVSYLYRDPRHYNIDIVRPKALLSELLKQMTGGDVVCEMPTGAFTDYTYLAAAESVRGIPKAKIHTSFNKFNDWMNCNGFVFMVQKQPDGSEMLAFVSRNNLYDNSGTTEINEVRDLEISINTNAIYSGIEIGYEKKEYDEVNGRFEFNVQHSYSTGVTVSDNIKKMISPYRADCFGVEFLVREREETKDDKSDNDLFVISALSEIYGKIIPDRIFYPISETAGRPKYLFNGRYSPSNLLERNLSYLGANAVEMVFTSTEGSENTTINNRSEHRDMAIVDRLFRAEILKCTSYAHSYKELPLYQLIQFKHKGKTYKGFIYDVTEELVPGLVELELICYGIE